MTRKLNVTVESRMKRDFTQQKKWLSEMLDKVGWGFNPEGDFNDYIGIDKQPLFTPEEAEANNQQMAECLESFEYFYTAPGDDIYSFCHNHLTSLEHAIHSFINQNQLKTIIHVLEYTHTREVNPDSTAPIPELLQHISLNARTIPISGNKPIDHGHSSTQKIDTVRKK